MTQLQEAKTFVVFCHMGCQVTHNRHTFHKLDSANERGILNQCLGVSPMSKIPFFLAVIGLSLFNLPIYAQSNPEAPFPSDGIWVEKGASIDCGRKPDDTFFEVKGKTFRFVTPNGSEAECSMYKTKEQSFTDVRAMEVSLFCRFAGEKKQFDDSETFLFHSSGSIFYRTTEHVEWCPTATQNASPSNLDTAVLGKSAIMCSKFACEGSVISASGIDSEFAQIRVQLTKKSAEEYCEVEGRLVFGTKKFRKCVTEEMSTINSMSNCKTGQISLGFQQSKTSTWQVTDAAKAGKATDPMEKFERTFWRKVGPDDTNEIIPVYPLTSYFNLMCPTNAKQWKIQ
jgi:hypothetical protein